VQRLPSHLPARVCLPFLSSYPRQPHLPRPSDAIGSESKVPCRPSVVQQGVSHRFRLSGVAGAFRQFQISRFLLLFSNYQKLQQRLGRHSIQTRSGSSSHQLPAFSRFQFNFRIPTLLRIALCTIHFLPSFHSVYSTSTLHSHHRNHGQFLLQVKYRGHTMTGMLPHPQLPSHSPADETSSAIRRALNSPPKLNKHRAIPTRPSTAGAA
jgi:hypothetical protein